jgi:hypothetical protein
MKTSDVEIGAVYRYTYRGPATGAMNRHGPWLVGNVVQTGTAGMVLLEPVVGLPIARSRPPAGARLAVSPTADAVHAARLGGRLCHSDDYTDWLETYSRQQDTADEARVARDSQMRYATIDMVAAFKALGLDVGRGPWDRSTQWGQLVDDMRRRELDVVHVISEALVSYAGVEMVAPGSDARTAAEKWMTATIKEGNDE